MKQLLLFWRTVLKELGTWCRVSTDLDWKHVKARFEKEGDEFLTITLPTFAQDLERALDEGEVGPDLFPGFRKKGKTPILFGSLMDLLFDRDTGLLLYVENEDSPQFFDAIFAIRQLTLMFAKIEKQCTPEREEAALKSYIECEQELKEVDRSITPEDREAFGSVANFLFRGVYTALDSDVYYGTLVPKHGPGSTADRILGNEKFDQAEWTTRLESVFPFGEYAIPNWRYYYLLDRVQFLEPGEERPVRVVLVPKTQKTPRVIAIEPVCMQYMQQAISQRLVHYLECDFVNDDSNRAKGMIGFTDQTPNQVMACEGSRDGSMATLDLSEASDRVSNLLVRELFRYWENLDEAIQVTRSTRADVPGHGVISLTKFASMGSALCFPIEAMVFLTVVWIAICEALNKPMRASLLHEYRDQVRVYGDDIIVPAEFATCVKDKLEAFGLKVNPRKSFWTGRFRESCGGDYYAGEDVTVVRFRREFPTSRADVPEVLSTVSLRNQLYAVGLMKSVAELDKMLGEVLPHYPSVYPDSSAVGRHTSLEYDVSKMSDTLHAPLVRAYVTKSITPRSEISGEGALLKCLTKEGLLPFEDVKHLERQGRPDAVRLKLRWVHPF